MLYPHRFIQLKQTGCAAADCGPPFNPGSNKLEVLRPLVAARIKQAHELAILRIDCPDVASFVSIAFGACQGEVFR